VASDQDPRHRETRRSWDVVARTKYRVEFDEHVALLRAGGNYLLDAEAQVLAKLLPGSHVVQFQCSHGADALGLLNAGAASVVGVDISGEMISQAEAKADAVGAQSASFVRADVTSLPTELDETADLVYTGRGSLPWVLDLPGWADAVRRVLKPRAHIFLFEGHPLASLWNREAESLELRPGASYFDEEPAEDPGFPADVVQREVGDGRPRMLERHWRPGEVMEVLTSAGLSIKQFREYPILFWDQFPLWPDDLKARLPNSYSILAQRLE
jgi:SAM-dependent methyltransferase